MNYPHKLKIHIAATLLGLSLLSMLLINIVFLLFWYQHLIQQRIVRVKETVDGWREISRTVFSNTENRYHSSYLQPLFTALGPECRQVLMVDFENVVTAVDARDQWGLQAMAYSSGETGKEIVRQLDKADIPFFFSPKVLVIVIPDIDQAKEHSALAVVIDTADILLELWAKQKIIFLYLLVNSIIIATIGYTRMWRLMLRPIEKLVSVADNYQVSEGGGLFTDKNRNEFGQLSRAMNNMVNRIELDRQKLCDSVDSLAEANRELKTAQKEVLQSEKLASAGRLSAGFAHEIGNPVAIVQGYLELLQNSDISIEENNQFAGRALVELQRIDRMLRQLLDVTSLKEGKDEPIDTVQILKDTFGVMETSFSKRAIRAQITTIKEPTYIWGDKELLRQVLINCLINAMDAVVDKLQGAPGGQITATLTTEEKESEEKVLIEVGDNGSGISEEDLDLIFEPFFTTKGPGKGTGLGLAVSYRIIKSMGGRIEVESVKGEGAFFRVILPVYNAEPH